MQIRFSTFGKFAGRSSKLQNCSLLRSVENFAIFQIQSAAIFLHASSLSILRRSTRWPRISQSRETSCRRAKFTSGAVIVVPTGGNSLAGIPWRCENQRSRRRIAGGSEAPMEVSRPSGVLRRSAARRAALRRRVRVRFCCGVSFVIRPAPVDLTRDAAGFSERQPVVCCRPNARCCCAMLSSRSRPRRFAMADSTGAAGSPQSPAQAVPEAP